MKLKLITLSVFVLVGFAFSVRITLAYDDKTTHPALTNEIVDFYNLTHSGHELTDEERAWLIEGSRLEDTAPRWINHFYDPIHKIGWTGEREGSLPVGITRIIARFGLSQNKPLSATEWVNNDIQQTDYSRYDGDQTWKKALDAYVSEDRRTAFIALGHVLHLLEDMAVPDHTRNDTHAPVAGIDDGSPYESYATQFDKKGITRLRIAKNLALAKVGEMQKSTVEESLASLAEYSNKYFFSKDTINDPTFSLPKIIEVKNGFGYGIDENGKEFLLIGADVKSEKKKGTDIAYSLKDRKEYWPIFNAYFLRLSKQVVLRGAGVIDLFYGSIDNARIAKEFPQHIYKVDLSVFRTPVFSIYGELANLGNSIRTAFVNTKNFVADVGGKLFGDSSPQGDIIVKTSVKDETQNTTLPPIPSGETFTYSNESELQTVASSVPAVAPTVTQVIAATSSPLLTTAATVASSSPLRTTPAARVVYSGGSGGNSYVAPKTLGCVNGNVEITEIMYDAVGSDSGKEWIELRNNGTTSILVSDMKLSEGNTNHLINSVRGGDMLGVGTYAILANDGSKFITDNPEYSGQVFHSAFSLSNEGEYVALKCDTVALHSVTYASSTGAHGDGQTLQLIEGVWRASIPTPGAQNVYVPPAVNQASINATFQYAPDNPRVGDVVQFDATSSLSASSSSVVYTWNFGDEVIASSTDTTSTHMFFTAQGFAVVLTVSSESGVSSTTRTVNVVPRASTHTNHPVISEVQVDGMRASDEFIELYNPTAQPISLAGYSVQYLSGRATSTAKIRSGSTKESFMSSAIIQPYGFYLLANSGALSSLLDSADMVYSHFSLSGDSEGGIIFLVDAPSYISGISDSSIVDGMAYGEALLPDISTSTLPASSKSLERKANASSTVDSMTVSEDRFEGNGYDSQSGSDFVVRNIPNPQSSKNYPETRTMPSEPVGPAGTVNSIGIYDVASSSIVFLWQPAKDFLGTTSSLTYRLYATSDASSTLIAETSSTPYIMAVSDATHTYAFDLRACDVDGLCSSSSTFSVLVRKNKIPVAVISHDLQVPRLGDVVTFEAASSTDSDGTIASYEWNFDDGAPTSSVGVSYPHAFSIVGEHNVILTVTDNEGARSSSTVSMVVAPKMEMTPSSFLLSQEDFGGGAVANIGYQTGMQFQYLGTGLTGAVGSISVYMAQDNYGNAPTSLPVQLFESDSLNDTPRVKVMDLYNPHGVDAGWGTLNTSFMLRPNKHYWFSVPSDSTGNGYLNTFPAKSSVSAHYPYNARYISGYIDSFTTGGRYRDMMGESGSLAYRVNGVSLP